MFSAEKPSIVFRRDFYRNRGRFGRAMAPAVILDTNVVLDWLLFDDPEGGKVGQAILRGEAQWIGTIEMRDEHFDVLGRAALSRWAPDALAQRIVWNTHCRLIEAAGIAPTADYLRCTDPKDQMFVDLAIAERPAWLLSRDKALLALKLPLQQYGVRVATPTVWAQGNAAAEATAL